MIDPFHQFADWFALAQAAEINDPDACALATISEAPDGSLRPDVRMVLLKSFDAAGFVFYTNFQSAKGRQLAAHPVATMDFHWKSLRRQIRISGAVGLVADAEADAYFASRPRESQLSAWASRQSEPLDQRETFEAAIVAAAARFPQIVPRPPHWGGFRLVPDWFEFWEDRAGRQHHRERVRRNTSGWTAELLYP